MKAETIKKRLVPELKKDGTPTQKLENSVFWLARLSLGERVHFLSWNRSKGHMNILGRERQDFVTKVLDLLKVKYTIGNDSPRRGATGEYVEVQKQHTTKLKQAVATIQDWDK